MSVEECMSYLFIIGQIVLAEALTVVDKDSASALSLDSNLCYNHAIDSGIDYSEFTDSEFLKSVFMKNKLKSSFWIDLAGASKELEQEAIRLAKVSPDFSVEVAKACSFNAHLNNQIVITE